MYSACLFCKAKLGTNDAVEHFPVGRRLAFDSSKGRLWVVCGTCGRWNLTPLETRWEAVEECERHFSRTTLRASTDNIGLARLTEGLELVRIGQPQRPEFAAWRYGDQFVRRRRHSMAREGTLGLVGLGMMVGGPALGGLFGGAGTLWMLSRTLHNHLGSRRVLAHQTHPDGTLFPLRVQHAGSLKLVPARQGEGFLLHLKNKREWLEFEGREAIQIAGSLLPHLNPGGGKASHVRAAVHAIEQAGSPDRYFAIAAQALCYRTSLSGRRPVHMDVGLAATEIRLALEMAAHEETERAALDGELHRLEHAWREAEEIAAIADTLLLPAWVEGFVRKHRLGSEEVQASKHPHDAS